MMACSSGGTLQFSLGIREGGGALGKGRKLRSPPSLGILHSIWGRVRVSHLGWWKRVSPACSDVGQVTFPF